MMDNFEPDMNDPQEPKAPETPAPAVRARVVTSLANMKMLETTVKPIAAKDCNMAEFNQFISIARDLGLDPLKREIYAFVFNKDKPEKRSMAVVIGIQGYLNLASRDGTYCPHESPPVIRTDKRKIDPDSNPHGIVHVTAYAYKKWMGEKQRVSGRVYWDERAPIREHWTQDETGFYANTGRRYIEKDSPWWRQGRTMIQKCALVECIRKGWPEQFGNVYAEEEIERYRILDLTPSDYAELGRQAQLASLREWPGCMIDWLDGELEVHVAYDKLPNRLKAFMELNADDPKRVVQWYERNKRSFNEFFKARPRLGHGLKVEIEVFEKRLKADSGGPDPSYRMHDVPGGRIMSRARRPDPEPS